MLQKGITCFELRLFIYLLILWTEDSILCWGSQAGLILIFTAVGT